MGLIDARGLAIRRQVRIRFPLGEGQVLTHQELQILAEGPAAAREGEE